MNKLLTAAAALVAAAFLAGCGGAPSESEMKAAFDKQMAADMQGMNALTGGRGSEMMKSLLPEIRSMKKIGCKEDGEKAYRCDVELEVAQAGTTRKGPASLRFVKLSDGWGVQK